MEQTSFSVYHEGEVNDDTENICSVFKGEPSRTISDTKGKTKNGKRYKYSQLNSHEVDMKLYKLSDSPDNKSECDIHSIMNNMLTHVENHVRKSHCDQENTESDVEELRYYGDYCCEMSNDTLKLDCEREVRVVMDRMLESFEEDMSDNKDEDDIYSVMSDILNCSENNVPESCSHQENSKSESKAVGYYNGPHCEKACNSEVEEVMEGTLDSYKEDKKASELFDSPDKKNERDILYVMNSVLTRVGDNVHKNLTNQEDLETHIEAVGYYSNPFCEDISGSLLKLCDVETGVVMDSMSVPVEDETSKGCVDSDVEHVMSCMLGFLETQDCYRPMMNSINLNGGSAVQNCSNNDFLTNRVDSPVNQSNCCHDTDVVDMMNNILTSLENTPGTDKIKNIYDMKSVGCHQDCFETNTSCDKSCSYDEYFRSQKDFFGRPSGVKKHNYVPEKSRSLLNLVLDRETENANAVLKEVGQIYVSEDESNRKMNVIDSVKVSVESVLNEPDENHSFSTKAVVLTPCKYESGSNCEKNVHLRTETDMKLNHEDTNFASTHNFKNISYMDTYSCSSNKAADSYKKPTVDINRVTKQNTKTSSYVPTTSHVKPLLCKKNYKKILQRFVSFQIPEIFTGFTKNCYISSNACDGLESNHGARDLESADCIRKVNKIETEHEIVCDKDTKFPESVFSENCTMKVKEHRTRETDTPDVDLDIFAVVSKVIDSVAFGNEGSVEEHNGIKCFEIGEVGQGINKDIASTETASEIAAGAENLTAFKADKEKLIKHHLKKRKMEIQPSLGTFSKLNKNDDNLKPVGSIDERKMTSQSIPETSLHSLETEHKPVCEKDTKFPEKVFSENCTMKVKEHSTKETDTPDVDFDINAVVSKMIDSVAFGNEGSVEEQNGNKCVEIVEVGQGINKDIVSTVTASEIAAKAENLTTFKADKEKLIKHHLKKRKMEIQPLLDTFSKLNKNDNLKPVGSMDEIKVTSQRLPETSLHSLETEHKTVCEKDTKFPENVSSENCTMKVKEHSTKETYTPDVDLEINAVVSKMIDSVAFVNEGPVEEQNGNKCVERGEVGQGISQDIASTETASEIVASAENLPTFKADKEKLIKHHLKKRKMEMRSLLDAFFKLSKNDDNLKPVGSMDERKMTSQSLPETSLHTGQFKYNICLDAKVCEMKATDPSEASTKVTEDSYVQLPRVETGRGTLQHEMLIPRISEIISGKEFWPNGEESFSCVSQICSGTETAPSISFKNCHNIEHDEENVTNEVNENARMVVPFKVLFDSELVDSKQISEEQQDADIKDNRIKSNCELSEHEVISSETFDASKTCINNNHEEVPSIEIARTDFGKSSSEIPFPVLSVKKEICDYSPNKRNLNFKSESIVSSSGPHIKEQKNEVDMEIYYSPSSLPDIKSDQCQQNGDCMKESQSNQLEFSGEAKEKSLKSLSLKSEFHNNFKMSSDSPMDKQPHLVFATKEDTELLDCLGADCKSNPSEEFLRFANDSVDDLEETDPSHSILKNGGSCKSENNDLVHDENHSLNVERSESFEIEDTQHNMEESFFCRILNCSKVLKSVSDYIIHLKQDHKKCTNISCYMCDVKMSSLKPAFLHMAGHNKLYVCLEKACFFSCVSETEMDHHVNLSHKNSIELRPSSWFCYYCNLASGKGEIKRHWSKQHSSKPFMLSKEPLKTPQSSDVGYYCCPRCLRTSTDIKAYKRHHMLQHHCYWLCSFCFGGFKDFARLKKHSLNYHKFCNPSVDTIGIHLTTEFKGQKKSGCHSSQSTEEGESAVNFSDSSIKRKPKEILYNTRKSQLRSNSVPVEDSSVKENSDCLVAITTNHTMNQVTNNNLSNCSELCPERVEAAKQYVLRGKTVKETGSDLKFKSTAKENSLCEESSASNVTVKSTPSSLGRQLLSRSCKVSFEQVDHQRKDIKVSKLLQSRKTNVVLAQIKSNNKSNKTDISNESPQNNKPTTKTQIKKRKADSDTSICESIEQIRKITRKSQPHLKSLLSAQNANIKRKRKVLSLEKNLESLGWDESDNESFQASDSEDPDWKKEPQKRKGRRLTFNRLSAWSDASLFGQSSEEEEDDTACAEKSNTSDAENNCTSDEEYNASPDEGMENLSDVENNSVSNSETDCLLDPKANLESNATGPRDDASMGEPRDNTTTKLLYDPEISVIRETTVYQNGVTGVSYYGQKLEQLDTSDMYYAFRSGFKILLHDYKILRPEIFRCRVFTEKLNLFEDL